MQNLTTDVTEVLSSLPEQRIATFRAATTSHAEAIRLYSWNIEMSASLWGGFHLLEVVLRNRLHECLVSHFGCAEWWTKAALSADDLRLVTRAQDTLEKRTPGWTAGHLVAELSFGFWIGLLANRYHAALWGPALSQAFVAPVRRGEVHASFERLRKLRNRVAHHEPIFGRDLTGDHDRMLELLSVMAPATSEWLRSHSRVPEIVASRAATVAGQREASF